MGFTVTVHKITKGWEKIVDLHQYYGIETTQDSKKVKGKDAYT